MLAAARKRRSRGRIEAMETDLGASSNSTIGTRLAIFLVAATSGLVLVIEILAGRLVAPYVGVSLETFTGIIGTILAGIAIGAAVGGSLADRYDPVRLIAQALFYGGALTWLSIPIVSILGPNLGSGPLAIVVLAAGGFLAPAAVLSGIGPMVAKLELGSLDDTGAVVGRLSAAGTFGALIGTFGTGFVLIALLPVRTIIIAVGLILVVSGIALFLSTKRARPTGADIAFVLIAALGSVAINSPCDQTTTYYCVRVVADDPAERPGGRSLIIDQLRHAHVDLDDPTFLDIRYMRLFADVSDSLPDGPIRVLHVGGGGFSLPRYLNAIRPGTENVVLELDPELVDIAEVQLGLTDADSLDIRTGDARLHLDDLADDSFDLIVGDAYSGSSVPWHLTTVEVVEQFDRLLSPGGTYMMNVIDGNENRFADAQLATLGEVFDELALIEPEGGIGSFAVNQILIAQDGPIEPFDIDPTDGRRLEPEELAFRIDEDDLVLTDNFAPADQLLR